MHNKAIHILHVSAHFGGGVGTILYNVIYELSKFDFYSQQLVLLDNINAKGISCCSNSKINYRDNVAPTDHDLHTQVEQADIVIVHFWNHPLIYKFLHSFSGKTARIIFWCHTNGHNAPQSFTEAMIWFPSTLAFSTDYSYSSPLIVDQPDDFIKHNTTTIFDSAGTNGYENIIHQPHSNFNVGYIGTVNYSKIHREFISICSKINIPNAKFIVCGEDENNIIEQEVIDSGYFDKFDFRGYATDITPILSILDVFGYPLHSGHYGTGEQVLIEAMSAGIPQVVLNNGAEQFVVKNGVTGFVADTIPEYIAAIEELYHDAQLRKTMSEASRQYAIEHYSIGHIINLWRQAFANIVKREKQPCIFSGAENITNDAELFLSSLGKSEASDTYTKALSFFPGDPPEEIKEQLASLPPIYHASTKGSLKHYNTFLQDIRLQYLVNIK